MNTAVKKVILLLLLIIVTCTFPSIRPCSWRYAQPSSATRDPTVDGSGLPGVVRASRQHSHFFRQEYVADVDGFFFLLQDPLGVTCCTFANALLHLVLSSLLCEFTAPLEFSKQGISQKLDTCSPLPLTPVLFSSGAAFLYLTIQELFLALGSPVLCLLLPHTWIQPCILHPTSQDLCCPTGPVFLHSASSCYRQKHLTLCRTPACCCCLYKVMVVIHRHLVIRKNAVTGKPSENKAPNRSTKIQTEQPDKPPTWGLANSVHFPWLGTSNAVLLVCRAKHQVFGCRMSDQLRHFSHPVN